MSEPSSSDAKIGPASIRWTNLYSGDMYPASEDVDKRRRAIVDRVWTWHDQQHGSAVVREHTPGEMAGSKADGCVSTHPDSVLSIYTADCAGIALVGDNESFAAVHAGWRGVSAGVIGSAVAEMTRTGAKQIKAAIGPMIHAECNEFGVDDLESLAAQFGDEVIGATKKGAPSFDLPAAIRIALRRLDIPIALDADTCTSCDPDYFSHRSGDSERNALVVWIP